MQVVWETLERRPGRVFVAFVAFAYLLAASGIPLARAQQTSLPVDYRVGPGDRIFLGVPQRPDLNRELLVDADGEVNLPLIGDVLVRGMTASEIENRLLQALREYYPSVNRTQIRITQAISNVIYVTGDVRSPGKYTFTEAVTVWEVIREAGGPMPTAALDAVRIVQDRTRGGGSIVVNVAGALEAGSVDRLPTLEPGDTVIIPTQEEQYTGNLGVNVMGAVVRPGVYRIQARQDLMSAILLAGGPTERAKLGDVRIIRPNTDGTAQTMKIDLNLYLRKGVVSANPKLQSGDTVHIGRKSVTSAEVGTVLSLVTTLATLTLLYYTIQDRQRN